MFWIILWGDSRAAFSNCSNSPELSCHPRAPKFSSACFMVLTPGGYLSQECSQNMINCMADVKKSGSPSFAGNQCDVNETIEVITVVMQAALAAGGFIHDP
nr:phospholipase a2-alpha [Quercus suber]